MTDLRKIDALVAEHVMGVDWGHSPYVPYYSSDMTAAWLVVEKLRADGWQPVVDHSFPGETTVEIEFSEAGLDDHQGRFYITETTAPLAICLAALKAKGIEA